MAAITPTNIGTTIALGGVTPITYGEGGLITEIWRCLGGTAGDTVTITPTIVADIRTVVTPLNAGHSLSTNVGNTQVVFTLGTGVVATSSYDIHITGRRR